MDNTLLSVRNLSIHYRTSSGAVPAVDGISFDVNRGEIFALVGESGCGKSTTALGLMRLVPEPGRISGGSALFDGMDLASLNEREMPEIRGKRIGMIFQNPLDSLNPVYSVGHQVSEGLVLDKVSPRDAWKRVIQVFNDVRISDADRRASNYPYEFSGGMRQRVMIGMMLARKPELLIADEPTTALDVTIQAQILELLKDVRKRYGTSILVITHDFGIVAEIADRVGVMYSGKLVETGGVFDIFEKPSHPYTRLLLRALPRIKKSEGRLETIPGNLPDLSRPAAGCRFYDRCPVALPKCAVEEPMLSETDAGHFRACHRED